MQSIPSITFNTKSPEYKGFEVFKFERIAASAKNMSHDGTLPHRLEFYMLMLYTHGLSKQQVDFNWYSVQKGSLVYLSKGQVNGFNFTPNLNGYCMVFTQEFLDKILGKLPTNVVFRLFTPQLFDPLIDVPSESNLYQYVELIYNEFSSKTLTNKSAVIESLFTIILTKAEALLKQQTLQVQESQALNIFSEFADLVKKHFADNRNADYFAHQLGITYKHLNVICKSLTQRTAKQFIDDYIILEAKRLMVGTEIKSTQLAYALGFEEPTNFTKFFKKHTQLTPSQFLDQKKTN